MLKTKIFPLIKALRLQGSIAMNLFILIPLMVYTKDIAFSIIQTVPFVLMISGEIALNDSFDIEKDKINKPHRPLVCSSVSVKEAIIFSCFILALSIGVGFFVYLDNYLKLVIFLTLLIVLSLYNIRLSFMPLLKTFITAISTVLALSFLWAFPVYSHRNYVFFLIAALFFVWGRECLMDIRDMEGDKENTYTTLALLFGKNRMMILSFISIAIANLFNIIYVISDFVIYKLCIAIITATLSSIICYKFAVANSKEQLNRLSILMWMPMLLMLSIII